MQFKQSMLYAVLLGCICSLGFMAGMSLNISMQGMGARDIAGSSTRGAEFLHSFGDITKIGLPGNIAVNSSDYVFVPDEFNDTVWIYDPNGTFVGSLGSAGSGQGEFDKPLEMAINDSDYIHVIDDYNSRIQIFAPDTSFVREIPFGSTLSLPHKIAINSTGHMYFCDQDGEWIKVLSPAGELIYQWGQNGTGIENLNHTSGIGINSTGSIFVCDVGNDTVKVYSPIGEFLHEFEGPWDNYFDYVHSITFDAADWVYLGQQHNSRVGIFNPKGEYINTVTSPGSGLGENNYIEGVAINSTGELLVVNWLNHNINAFKLTVIPDAPENVSLATDPDNNGEVFINWHESEDATGYRIYRNTSWINDFDPSLTLVADVATNATYTDTVPSNGTYYYVVVAYNDDGNSSISACESIFVVIEPSGDGNGPSKIPGMLTPIMIVASIMAIVMLSRKLRKNNHLA